MTESNLTLPPRTSKDFHDNVHCQCVLVYIESVLCNKAFCVDCAHI